jgi:hypothetical protein
MDFSAQFLVQFSSRSSNMFGLRHIVFFVLECSRHFPGETDAEDQQGRLRPDSLGS